LDRFSQVLGSDRRGVVEITDSVGNLENAVVRASAQPHPADGHLERSLTGVVQLRF
jgi:hypothetical protein